MKPSIFGPDGVGVSTHFLERRVHAEALDDGSTATKGSGVPCVFSVPLPALQNRIVPFALFIQGMDLQQLELVVASPVEPSRLWGVVSPCAGLPDSMPLLASLLRPLRIHLGKKAPIDEQVAAGDGSRVGGAQ